MLSERVGVAAITQGSCCGKGSYFLTFFMILLSLRSDNFEVGKCSYLSLYNDNFWSCLGNLLLLSIINTTMHHSLVLSLCNVRKDLFLFI